MDGSPSSRIAKNYGRYELSDTDLSLPQNSPTRERKPLQDAYRPSKIYQNDELKDDDIGRMHLMKIKPSILETKDRTSRKDSGASTGLGIKEPNATGISDKEKESKKAAGVTGVRERRAIKEKSDQGCESKEEPKAATEVASSTLVVIKREGCRVCGDDDQHIFGCPYEDYVPLGATVCPGYFVICWLCGRDLEQPVGACWMCGKRGGRAMAKACSNCHTSFDHMAGDCPLWKGDRNPANSPEYKADPVMYTEEPVMAEYIEP